ncbi:hypothetical protein [Palleronia sp. LCG004]|nr:hypothetical protein [Palleronia sp. LCG004]WOI54973.1 hypothetical protein RVY76_07800 [Palleronia sp. LCG004]
MTPDEIDMRILRAVARGLSSPMRDRVARLLGILPPDSGEKGGVS